MLTFHSRSCYSPTIMIILSLSLVSDLMTSSLINNNTSKGDNNIENIQLGRDDDKRNCIVDDIISVSCLFLNKATSFLGLIWKC